MYFLVGLLHLCLPIKEQCGSVERCHQEKLEGEGERLRRELSTKKEEKRMQKKESLRKSVCRPRVSTEFPASTANG